MLTDNKVLSESEQLLLTLRSIYEKNGYRKYAMSRFEEYRLYMENKNFLVSESVISFTDLDGRLLALKPDVTLSIVSHSNPNEEQRVYYIENVYRPDKARLNYREIGQLGLERIGKIDTYAIIETALLAAETLYAVSPESLLEIGHMGFTMGLFGALQISPEYIEKLLNLIKEKNVHSISALCLKAGISEVAREMLCAIPSLCGDFDEVIARAKKLCISNDMNDALSQLAAIKAATNIDKACRIRLDLSLIGEVDYYNGIILAGYVNGLPAAVLSGGQYDKVMQKFSKSNGAIGFALYLNEIEMLFEDRGDFDFDVKLIYSEDTSPEKVFEAVEKIKAAGKSVYPCPKGAVTAIKTAKEERL